MVKMAHFSFGSKYHKLGNSHSHLQGYFLPKVQLLIHIT